MKRNKFSLSYTNLLSCAMGELVPIGLEEVLPGDSIQHTTSALVRTQPLLAPIFHPVEVRIHHWFVPFRLIWDGWEDFITGGPDGMNTAVPPYMNSTNVSVSSLLDYLGIPTGHNTAIEHSAMPIRAYNLIWNEWYRDQDLQAEKVVGKGAGLDTTTNVNILNCAWEKDYFTSSRPWEQKGPQVSIPVDGMMSIDSNGEKPTFSIYPSGTQNVRLRGTSDNSLATTAAIGASNELKFGNETGLVGNLSGVGVSVNQLREAMAIQRYEEARARYGSRYTEYLRYLGVRSSDARLQRPEYLGGGRNVIQFSEVLATAEGETTNVGDLKGHGIAAVRSNRYRRFFEEHGLILSLMSIRPKTIYMDGLPRMWRRKIKEDYWQKELQHIGQQEVLNAEVFAGSGDPNGVFGYQDRYDEYRRNESTVHGEFRTILDFWHMARKFTGQPALNASFVECVPTERVFPVQINDPMWIMVKHSMQARRMVAASGNSFIF